MAGIKVDPPPVNMQIIDMKTGRPTRPFIEFMHRLWQRTGGEVDAIEDLDVTNIYLEREKGASEEQINEAIQNLSALVHAKAPQPDVLDAIESLKAVTLANITSARSEIGELRKDLDSISVFISAFVIPSLPASNKPVP
jgi:phosphoglycerate dehydrogenase-like enzyme